MINYPRSDKTGASRWIPSWKLVLGGLVTMFVVLAGLFAIAVYVLPVPQPNDVAMAETTKVMYADGKHEIGRIGEVRRTSVPLSDVPVEVQQAVLAAEDRDFYDHGGFSPEGIGRAFWNNLTGGTTQGGSTITQQYVKNAYLNFDQTLFRKANELVLAVKLETIESKDQILENYLNTIYFGRGAYGIEAAAEAYFDKHAKDLDLAEGAALAAIIQSPGNYEPELFEDRLVERWNYVLDAMAEKGWISAQDRKDVEFPEFIKQKRGNQLKGQVGYILEAVKREMQANGWTDAEIDGGGLTITTTIQKDAQAAAVSAVESAGPQYSTEGVRIGVVGVEPGTGRILAIYGGKNYLKDQLDNALQARAQGGSTFKAFALTAAIDEGYGLDHMLYGGSPATIDGYTLQNFGNSSYGTVSLLNATQSSVNTAYVQMESEVGVDNVIKASEKLGLPADTPGIEENLTFVLGSASPRPIDMASAFSTFAARGVYAPPTILKEVTRNTGEVAYKAEDRSERVYDETTMDTVNQALQAVVYSGTATRASWLGRPAAGKTGTTDESKSAWFVGYTPNFSAAVMMTKADKKGNPVSLDGTGGLGSITGGSFPAAIWAEFAAGALANQPVESFAYPGGEPSTVPTETWEPEPTEEPSPTESPSESPTKKTPSPTGEPTPTKKPTPSPSPSTPSPTGADRQAFLPDSGQRFQRRARRAVPVP